MQIVDQKEFARHFDTTYDKGNNLLRSMKSNITSNIESAFEIFFEHRQKGKETVVMAGHSHQFQQMMDYLVEADPKWFERKHSGALAAHDKLNNGGGMEVVVEKIKCGANVSYQEVPGTFKQLHGGLQNKQLKKAQAQNKTNGAGALRGARNM